MTHQIVKFAHETLGVKLHPGQQEALSGFYESARPNWLLISGRRGGKSLLADIIACYEALVPDFSDVLRRGETRHVLIMSVRSDNAALHIRNIGKLLRHNRSIGKMIIRENADSIELSNGVIILSLPASARAGRGFTASTVILDELAFFVDTEGNSSSGVVFQSLQPTVATFGDRGRVIITTSAGARTGIVYELHETPGDDFYVTVATSRELNPQVSQKVIDNAMRRDPESAAAEYMSEFRDPLEAYLSSELLERCIDKTLSEADQARQNVNYVMAIDPATQRDRYGYMIAHMDKGLVIVDYARALKAPVNITQAEALLLELAAKFRPTTIRCDTASTTERLRSKLGQLEYTPFSRPMKLRIYGALKEHLNLGRLVLYPHQDLLDELKALQIRNGVDIAAPRSGRVTHDDLADCLALCVDALVGSGYVPLGDQRGLEQASKWITSAEQAARDLAYDLPENERHFTGGFEPGWSKRY